VCEIWNGRRKLQGSSVFVSESFAAETKAKRRELQPYMMAARKSGSNASLVVDKLRVEKIIYKNTADIPKEFTPIHTRREGNAVVFYSRNAPLSNFYPSPIKIQGYTYSSVEQYYQAEVAKFYGDENTRRAILTQKDPAEHKRSSKAIKGLDRQQWHETRALSVMREALEAKFTQHEDLATKLKETEDDIIGEASSYDTFWGIGLPLWSKDIGATANWTGENQLGKTTHEH